MWIVFCYSASGAQWFAGVYNSVGMAEHRAAKLRQKWAEVEVAHCDGWQPEREMQVPA